jgi:hypothetical protein
VTDRGDVSRTPLLLRTCEVELVGPTARNLSQAHVPADSCARARHRPFGRQVPAHLDDSVSESTAATASCPTAELDRRAGAGRECCSTESAVSGTPSTRASQSLGRQALGPGAVAMSRAAQPEVRRQRQRGNQLRKPNPGSSNRGIHERVYARVTSAVRRSRCGLLGSGPVENHAAAVDSVGGELETS